MPLYLLFFGYKDTGGGADDFHSVHTDLDAAKQAGIDEWKDGDVRLGSWMHLAELTESDLRIIAVLNIPGTEYDETGLLEWRTP
jgi:hypothetical protein